MAFLKSKTEQFRETLRNMLDAVCKQNASLNRFGDMKPEEVELYGKLNELVTSYEELVDEYTDQVCEMNSKLDGIQHEMKKINEKLSRLEEKEQ